MYLVPQLSMKIGIISLSSKLWPNLVF